MSYYLVPTTLGVPQQHSAHHTDLSQQRSATHPQPSPVTYLCEKFGDLSSSPHKRGPATAYYHHPTYPAHSHSHGPAFAIAVPTPPHHPSHHPTPPTHVVVQASPHHHIVPAPSPSSGPVASAAPLPHPPIHFTTTTTAPPPSSSSSTTTTTTTTTTATSATGVSVPHPYPQQPYIPYGYTAIPASTAAAPAHSSHSSASAASSVPTANAAVPIAVAGPIIYPAQYDASRPQPPPGSILVPFVPHSHPHPQPQPPIGAHYRGSMDHAPVLQTHLQTNSVIIDITGGTRSDFIIQNTEAFDVTFSISPYTTTGPLYTKLSHYSGQVAPQASVQISVQADPTHDLIKEAFYIAYTRQTFSSAGGSPPIHLEPITNYASLTFNVGPMSKKIDFPHLESSVDSLIEKPGVYPPTHHIAPSQIVAHPIMDGTPRISTATTATSSGSGGSTNNGAPKTGPSYTSASSSSSAPPPSSSIAGGGGITSSPEYHHRMQAGGSGGSGYGDSQGYGQPPAPQSQSFYTHQVYMTEGASPNGGGGGGSSGSSGGVQGGGARDELRRSVSEQIRSSMGQQPLMPQPFVMQPSSPFYHPHHQQQFSYIQPAFVPATTFSNSSTGGIDAAPMGSSMGLIAMNTMEDEDTKIGARGLSARKKENPLLRKIAGGKRAKGKRNKKDEEEEEEDEEDEEGGTAAADKALIKKRAKSAAESSGFCVGCLEEKHVENRSTQPQQDGTFEICSSCRKSYLTGVVIHDFNKLRQKRAKEGFSLDHNVLASIRDELKRQWLSEQREKEIQRLYRLLDVWIDLEGARESAIQSGVTDLVTLDDIETAVEGACNKFHAQQMYQQQRQGAGPSAELLSPQSAEHIRVKVHTVMCGGRVFAIRKRDVKLGSYKAFERMIKEAVCALMKNSVRNFMQSHKGCYSDFNEDILFCRPDDIQILFIHDGCVDVGIKIVAKPGPDGTPAMQSTRQSILESFAKELLTQPQEEIDSVLGNMTLRLSKEDTLAFIARKVEEATSGVSEESEEDESEEEEEEYESSESEEEADVAAARLQLYIEKNDIEGAQRLITNGECSVSCRFQHGWTPLHWAAAHGKPEMTALLVSLNASAVATDELGWTPVHHAIVYGRVKNLKEIAIASDFFSALYIPDSYGKTPIDFAYLTPEGSEIRQLILLFDRQMSNPTLLQPAFEYAADKPAAFEPTGFPAMYIPGTVQGTQQHAHQAQLQPSQAPAAVTRPYSQFLELRQLVQQTQQQLQAQQQVQQAQQQQVIVATVTPASLAATPKAEEAAPQPAALVSSHAVAAAALVAKKNDKDTGYFSAELPTSCTDVPMSSTEGEWSKESGASKVVQVVLRGKEDLAGETETDSMLYSVPPAGGASSGASSGAKPRKGLMKRAKSALSSIRRVLPMRRRESLAAEGGLRVSGATAAVASQQDSLDLRFVCADCSCVDSASAAFDKCELCVSHVCRDCRTRHISSCASLKRDAGKPAAPATSAEDAALYEASLKGAVVPSLASDMQSKLSLGGESGTSYVQPEPTPFIPSHPASNKYWYAGSVDVNRAAMMLTSWAIDGAYLVRASANRPGSYTLSVYYQKVLHIRIQNDNNRYSLGPGNFFSSVAELIEFFQRNPLSIHFYELKVALTHPRGTCEFSEKTNAVSLLPVAMPLTRAILKEHEKLMKAQTPHEANHLNVLRLTKVPQAPDEAPSEATAAAARQHSLLP